MKDLKNDTLTIVLGIAGYAIIWSAGSFLLALGVFLVHWSMNVDMYSKIDEKL